MRIAIWNVRTFYRAGATKELVKETVACKIDTRMCSASGAGNVVGIATGYGLDGPGIESRWRARFSAPVQTGPGAHPASCTMGIGSFPGIKSGRGVLLTTHPLLVPWSRKRRAIPLLPLWAVQPVQSLSACTRVHFVCALQEIRLPGQGTVIQKNYMILHSGCKSDKNEFGKRCCISINIMDNVFAFEP